MKLTRGLMLRQVGKKIIVNRNKGIQKILTHAA
jgi:hypothetical protein